MKKFWLYTAAAVVAMIAGVVVQQTVQTPAAPTAANPPQLAFAYPDVDGKLQDVEQWRGKIMVVNFWASWCGPCLKEIPEFIALQNEYGAKNVQFIGIAIEDREPVVEYLQRVKVNYPVLVAGDAGSGLARQWGNIINAVPFTVIVNPQGQIVHRQPGELSRQQFIEHVQPLLESK